MWLNNILFRCEKEKNIDRKKAHHIMSKKLYRVKETDNPDVKKNMKLDGEWQISPQSDISILVKEKINLDTNKQLHCARGS